MEMRWGWCGCAASPADGDHVIAVLRAGDSAAHPTVPQIKVVISCELLLTHLFHRFFMRAMQSAEFLFPADRYSRSSSEPGVRSLLHGM